MDHNGNWVLQISYGKGRICNSCSLKYNFSFQQDRKEMKKRMCGINPCQLNLISYCSLFCLEHLSMDVLFLQHSCTRPFPPQGCCSLPSPLWKHPPFYRSHANDTGGTKSGGMPEFMGDGRTNLLTTPLIKQQLVVWCWSQWFCVSAWGNGER